MMLPAQVRTPEPSLKVTQLDAQLSQDLGIFQFFPLLISNSLPLWSESILCKVFNPFKFIETRSVALQYGVSWEMFPVLALEMNSNVGG